MKPTFSPCRIEPLEARIAPATLDITAGGLLTYTAGAGISNSLTLSIVGANYVFTDTGAGETITVTGAGAAGFTGGGTNTVQGPNTAVTSMTVILGDQSDQFALQALTDPLMMTDGAGADSVFVSGALNVGGALQLTGETIDVNAAIGGATTATLLGNAISIASTITASTRVTLQPLSATNDINLGAADAAGVLGLTDAEIDRITAPILQIGVAAGTIDIIVSAAITPANAGTLRLISTNTITDGAAGSIAVANLAISSTNGVTLDNAGNDVGTLAATVTVAGADFSFRDADDLIIGAVDGISGIDTTAANDTITLNAGATTQTAGANINTTFFELLGAGPFTLANAGNDVVNLSANLTGALTFTDADSLNIGVAGATFGITTSNAAVTVATVNGFLTVQNDDGNATPDLDAGSGAVSLTAGSVGVVDQPLTILANAGVVGTGGVTLVGDTISIVAAVNSGTATATLQPFQSGTLIDLGGADAANTLGLTDTEIDFVTAGILRIGRTDGASINFSAAISPANTSTLSLRGVGNVLNSGAAALQVANLAITGNGVNLDSATNQLGTIAGNATGSFATVFNIVSSTALTVGTVDGITGITATNGGVTLSADSMTISNAIVVPNTDVVTLKPVTAARPMDLGTEVAGSLSLTDAELDLITAGILRVGDTVKTGTVEVSAAITLGASVPTLSILSSSLVIGAGSLTVSNLRFSIGNTLFLNTASDVNTLAVNSAAGGFTFRDSDGIAIGTVDGVTGITMGAASLVSLEAGATTQAAGANITATALELEGAGPFTLTNAGNNVTNIAANVTGALSYTDANALTVTDVSGTNGVATFNSPIALVTVDGDLTISAPTPAIDVNAGTSTVTLTAGSAAGQNRALNVPANAGVTGTGGVTLTANAMALASAINAGSSTATLAAFTAGRQINLGTAAGVLDLTAAEIDFVSAGVLRIGSATGGALSIDAAISPANVSTLSLLSGATITDTGAGSVATANLRLSAATGVTLDGASNDVDALAGALTAAGGNFDFRDQNALIVATVDGQSGLSLGTGSLTLTAGGISQASPITQSAGGGAVTINGGAGIIALTQANDFTGPVALANTGANGVAITDSNAIDLATSSVGSGTLGITAVGITQTGALTQAAGGGAVTINGGAGVITLTQANDFTGGVSLANTGANAVAITDSNAIVLATSSVGSGALGITAVGITQTGALTQAAGGGAVTINGGAGVTTLTQANDFIGPVTLTNTAASAAITDANDLILAAQSIAQQLTISAPGAVTQTGAFTGAGGLTFNGPGTLTLSAANTFADVTLVNGGTLAGTGSVSSPLVISSGATLAPGTSPGIFSSGNAVFSIGSTLTVEINGATAGTGFDRLAVTGFVNLGGATFAGSATFTPPPATEFVIIDNDGTADPVTGTFAGLAEGAPVTLSGRDFNITYLGGDGNDVALKTARLATTLTWQGDAGANWSSGTLGVDTNWTDGTSQLLPQEGDTLVFPAGAANLTNTNDLAGLDLAGLTLSGLGYVIGGNAITLTGGVTASAVSGVGNAPAFNADLTLDGSQAFTVSGSAGATLGGAIALGGNTLTVAGAGSGTLTLAGSVSGAGSVVKDGASVLAFNGTQTGSTLTLTAGTLGGSGTTGALTATGGTVAPGASAGILHVAGGATLGAASTLAVELLGTTAGTSHDQLDVTGAVNLGGAALTLTVGFATTAGDTFTIVKNDGTDAITGTFAGLAEGRVIKVGADFFRITYAGGTDNNDVVLTRLALLPVTIKLPAMKTATFTDADGDLVTVKTSKGTFEQADFKVLATGLGGELALLDLSDDTGDFAFANISITSAKAKGGTGNGFTDVGRINSTGFALGTVAVDGDLGQVDATAGDPLKPALKALTVQSLGGRGLATQLDGASLASDIAGRLGNVTVKANLAGASLIASESIGNVAIKGSFLGGKISAGTTLGAVSVKGDLTGTLAAPVVISAFGKATAPEKGIDLAIKGLNVKGAVESLRLLAGYDLAGVGKNADAAIGAITVGTTWTSSTVLAGVAAGLDGLEGTADDAKFPVGAGVRDNLGIFSRIASILIKGAASGSAALGDNFGIIAEQIVSAKLNGEKLAFTKGPNGPTDFFVVADFGVGEARL